MKFVQHCVCQPETEPHAILKMMCCYVHNIQAKRWAGAVGRPEVQKFAGALQGQRAKKGVMITTSFFTPDAWEYVKKIDNKIVLIDADELANLMIDHNLGVSTMASYEVKKIDSDYFIE